MRMNLNAKYLGLSLSHTRGLSHYKWQDCAADCHMAITICYQPILSARFAVAFKACYPWSTCILLMLYCHNQLSSMSLTHNWWITHNLCVITTTMQHTLSRLLAHCIDATYTESIMAWLNYLKGTL